jgi:hypothetical protein
MIPLPNADPGQIVTINMDAVLPEKPEPVRSEWEFSSSAASAIKVYLPIVIGGSVTPTTTPCPTHIVACPTHIVACPTHVIACPTFVAVTPTATPCASHIVACPTHIVACPTHVIACPTNVIACPANIVGCPVDIGCPIL